MDCSYRTSHLHKGEIYDEAIRAQPFDNYMSMHERRIVSRVISEFVGGAIETYLDFACGTGRITSLFAPHAGASYGVDVSPSMLEQAKTRCSGTTFLLGDMTRQDLGLPEIDLASAFRFFGNAEQQLRREALGALHRCLRPGGLLVINNHRNPYAIKNVLHRWTGGRDPLDLSLGRLRALLRETGFQIARVYPVGAWLVRSSLTRRAVLESRLSGPLERLFASQAFAPISPDMVVVARKAK